jgi:hypothetical protein
MSDNGLFFCSATDVLLGPYDADDMGARMRGVRWVHEVLGIQQVSVVRADSWGDAQWLLEGGGTR